MFFDYPSLSLLHLTFLFFSTSFILTSLELLQTRRACRLAMSDSQMDCTAVWPSQVQYVDAGERTLLYRSRRGCVYRVFSKERNEWLVLKEEEVLEPNNLVRAVTAVQSLQSQFLLYHYSVRVQDGRMAALLMEQMDFTLRDVLAVQSRLAEAQVRAIALVALNALADLHERAGMVHGDLSPANIFFRRTGEMRLGDFSSAVPIDAAVEYFASTVLYSPVEALRNRQLVSRPSSDIWALGVVLNHCVSGERHPFVAAGASDFWKFLSELAEAEEETRRLQLQTHISGEFSELLSGMLSWNPASRPTAKELLNSRCLSQMSMCSARETLWSLVSEHCSLRS
ncbi:protein kinase, putative [Trypanosoma brucei brucei TREU927]|uniref:Protein kinase, putative n=2 Tax=Trypanozoon TaxID=39700 RepID=Q387P9_TRYB2|nr:protein kinase, putative [Trypanosoma brucei brucei TREU927]EAN78973.1 protein kinase, putative [Trypanosoma brucei brucei TREU927]